MDIKGEFRIKNTVVRLWANWQWDFISLSVTLWPHMSTLTISLLFLHAGIDIIPYREATK